MIKKQKKIKAYKIELRCRGCGKLKTTGELQCWECPICGYQKCLGLSHFCPTALKSKPNYSVKELDIALPNCIENWKRELKEKVANSPSVGRCARILGVEFLIENMKNFYEKTKERYQRKNY